MNTTKFVLLLATVAYSPAFSQTAPATTPLSISPPDVSVVNQHGMPAHLVSGLLKGHVAVINFVFTTDNGISQLMGSTFAKLERLLGARAGREIMLISITVDPGTDTPARLNEWAQRFGGGPGWTLLTGPRSDVERALKAFGTGPDKLQLTSVTLVGSADSGQWLRIDRPDSPSHLLSVVEGFLK